MLFKNIAIAFLFFSGTALSAPKIQDADIKASASINITKLANGTVDNTEFQFLDGVTSNIQAQINNIAASASSTGSGTVTSVNVTSSYPSILTATGGPITNSGSIALAFANQASQSFLAGPVSGSAASPSFRAIAASDLPSLSSLYALTGLSNLASVAINASLLPQTDDAIDLGSTSLQFSNAYVKNVLESNIGGDVSGNTGFIVKTKDSTGSTSGNMFVRSGTNSGGAGTFSGQAVFRSGNASAADGSTGAATYRSGDVLAVSGAGTSGGVLLRSGNIAAGTNTGVSGNVTINSGTQGAGNSGNTGALSIRSGNNSGSGNSGSITVQTGTVVGGTRGQVILDGSSISASNNQIKNVSTPSVSLDAANKAYVDAAAGVTGVASLTTANIWVGDGSSLAQQRVISGDATMSLTGALTIANTSVVPGSYSLANITVNSQGRITAASTGSATGSGSSVYSYIGSITYAGTSACQWANVNPTGGFVSFSADPDCSTPVVTGDATAPGTKIPGFTFSNIASGSYKVTAMGDFVVDPSVTSTACGFRFTDGTRTSNKTTTARNNGTIQTGSGAIIGIMDYTSATTSITIELQSYLFTGVAGNCNINNNTNGQDLMLTLEKIK